MFGKPTIFVPVLFLYFLGVFYLLLPNPNIIDLTNSKISNEPGDTWQNPDQKAFFTDKSRDEVINEFKSTFSLNFQNWSLPSYRLNYRPEDTATFVRPYIDSYYLEEIVHPFRESLFINGWNPSLSPKYSHLSNSEREKFTIIVDGEVFSSKVTIKPYFSSVFARLSIWTLIFPIAYLVFFSLKNTLKNLFSIIKKPGLFQV